MKEIADSVKASLRNVADSFAGVLSFDVDPSRTEAENVYRIIQQTATVCTVVACVNPVPLIDVAILSPFHAKMTFHIAKAKGFEITQDRALDILRELLSTIGLSLTTTWLASFVKPIPIVSFLVYAPMIYGATYGIGHVVEAYFHGMREGKVPSAEELREIFKTQSSKGKVEGATLRKEQMQQAYEELKKKVEEREKGHTPLGIRIKEKPVRRPAEKTMGDEEDSAPPPAASSEPSIIVEPKKTMGPATPARGVEIRATPVESAPPSGKALLDDLERLAKLKEIGALTAEEFELAKKKLLA